MLRAAADEPPRRGEADVRAAAEDERRPIPPDAVAHATTSFRTAAPIRSRRTRSERNTFTDRARERISSAALQLRVHRSQHTRDPDGRPSRGRRVLPHRRRSRSRSSRSAPSWSRRPGCPAPGSNPRSGTRASPAPGRTASAPQGRTPSGRESLDRVPNRRLLPERNDELILHESPPARRAGSSCRRRRVDGRTAPAGRSSVVRPRRLAEPELVEHARGDRRDDVRHLRGNRRQGAWMEPSASRSSGSPALARGVSPRVRTQRPSVGPAPASRPTRPSTGIARPPTSCAPSRRPGLRLAPCRAHREVSIGSSRRWRA